MSEQSILWINKLNLLIVVWLYFALLFLLNYLKKNFYKCSMDNNYMENILY